MARGCLATEQRVRLTLTLDHLGVHPWHGVWSAPPPLSTSPFRRLTVNDQQWQEWRRAEDRVFNAWYAALIAGAGTTLLGLWTMNTALTADPRRLYVPIDGLITIVLGWLTRRFRSRAAATLLLIRSGFFGATMLRQGYLLAALLTLGVFAVLYFQGLRGTIDLRRLSALRSAPSSGTVQDAHTGA